MSTWRAFATLLGSVLGCLITLELFALLVLQWESTSGLQLVLGFTSFELGLVVALGVAQSGIAAARTSGALGASFDSLTSNSSPRVSVLVAAWNEEASIASTLRSVLAQRDVELEIIVANDGSTDRTAERAALDARIRILNLSHRGKGAALESARRAATHEILVTIDADTELAEHALARLAEVFRDSDVVAAGGAIAIRRPDSLLEHFAAPEYQRMTWLRRGWAALGMLEQIPGAFSAFRASALERAGGFPEDSLTEDYEVSYRLYDRAQLDGVQPKIVLVPGARAWTESPATLPAFVRQRTRWFAGFLTTLWRFRRLIFSRRAGSFGVIRLPIKVVDAILPPIGLYSFGFLVVALASGALIPSVLSAALLGTRMLSDAVVHVLAYRLHERSAGLDRERGDRAPTRWFYVLAESLSYEWLRRAAVLRAYPFALSRARVWEQSRDRAGSSDAESSERALASFGGRESTSDVGGSTPSDLYANHPAPRRSNP